MNTSEALQSEVKSALSGSERSSWARDTDDPNSWWEMR